MDARNYWLEYVNRCGGLKATAKKLQSPYQTIASITNGHRGIGRELAQRFAAADPMLDATRLIWVRATQNSA